MNFLSLKNALEMYHPELSNEPEKIAILLVRLRINSAISLKEARRISAFYHNLINHDQDNHTREVEEIIDLCNQRFQNRQNPPICLFDQ